MINFGVEHWMKYRMSQSPRLMRYIMLEWTMTLKDLEWEPLRFNLSIKRAQSSLTILGKFSTRMNN